MRPDPKVGWHIYWMIPAYFCYEAYERTVTYAGIAYRKIKAKIQETPDIKRAKELAGIDK